MENINEINGFERAYKHRHILTKDMYQIKALTEEQIGYSKIVQLKLKAMKKH